MYFKKEMVKLDAKNNSLKLKLQFKWQKIVDFIHGDRADKISIILYIIIGSFAILNILNFIRLVKDPILMQEKNSIISSLLILLSLTTFFLSYLGKKLKKPSRRIPQFIFTISAISIFSLNYFANTLNGIFKNAIFSIKNIEVIPVELITGNIRVATFLVPLSIVIPISFLTLNILADDQNKKKLKELELKMLLPTVHKSDDTTIDIKICDDIDTGLPCIVPEKVAYEHFWVQGGTGSGKTSNFLLPLEEQLFHKKAYLNYKLKEVVYRCLENNIARIKIPVTNKWFNENFDINLVEPYEGKEKEFINQINRYILGVRDSNKVIVNKTIALKDTIELESLKNNDFFYEMKLNISKNGMDVDTFNIKINKGKENKTLNLNNYGTLISSVCERKLYVDENTASFKISEDMSQIIKIEIMPEENYEIDIIITLKGTGKIIPKDLGMTVIAPDGELIKNTINIAKEYGVKVHKIDPFMEEINKGDVAKFNPLKGDSPEKIGDIVASILASMEVGQSTRVNPYFINASVRAVRNLVILLKVTYPKIYDKDPTLEDVLSCLNDFNRVKNYVDYLEKDFELSRRWGSVIDYFKASFFDPPSDHSNQKARGAAIGSQKKKTQEAVSGIINQLDNLLAREEIRYILCDPKESIDLKQVLSKGECVAVSTRQGDLGARLGRAFALFFILSLQNEVLSRYAEGENPEIPHYLIIDEFAMYCNENTETFFTFARKYKCSVTIAIQNMGQLKRISDEFGETIFTNTTNKLLLPKSNLEDRRYWSAYFGKSERMELTTGVTRGALSGDNPRYSEQIRGSIKKIENVAEDEINDLNFQNLFYSYTDFKGRQVIGKGKTDFVKVRKEPFMDKIFDFEKYCISEDEYKTIIKEKEILKEHYKKKKEKDNISMVLTSSNTHSNIENKPSNKVYEEVIVNNTTDDNNMPYTVDTIESIVVETINEIDDKEKDSIIDSGSSNKDKASSIYEPVVIEVFEEIGDNTSGNYRVETDADNKEEGNISKDEELIDETMSFELDEDLRSFFISEE